jgi:hypothetical protein
MFHFRNYETELDKVYTKICKDNLILFLIDPVKTINILM